MSIQSIISRAQTRAVLAAWALVLAVLAAGVVHLGLENRQHSKESEAGEAALAVAVANVEPILSYRARTVEQDLAAAEALLTGKFKKNFVALGKELVAPSAKRDRIVTSASVVASALVSAEEDHVVTVLFINQKTKGRSMAKARVSGARLRVTLDLVDGEWLVSDLKPI